MRLEFDVLLYVWRLIPTLIVASAVLWRVADQVVNKRAVKTAALKVSAENKSAK